jgi:hypothetical protein
MSNSGEIENNESSTIFGVIKNQKDRPLTGVKVSSEKLETSTLFDGSYKLSVKPGLHTVCVELDGFSKEEKKIMINADEDRQLDFQLEEDIGTSRLYGQIISKENGKYIQNGLVYIIRPTINMNSKIDPKTGFYEFNKLPSGTFDVWISVLHYEDEKSTITIEDNEEVRHDFIVQKKRDEEVPWG